jgi:IS30 family transposase
VTLVERHSRFAMLIKVPSKDTAVVVTALSRHIRKLPATLRRSLTWDRGLTGLLMEGASRYGAAHGLY